MRDIKMVYYVVYGEIDNESTVLGEFKKLQDAVQYRALMSEVYPNTFIQEFWK